MRAGQVLRAALPALLLLAGCGANYRADTYATRAVQQANPVQQGVVVGARPVAVAPDGAAGAAVGGAAGGIVGAATPGSSVGSALAGVGGALVGGLFGTAAERATGERRAVEYVVRRDNGELISVTQLDDPPLPVGQRVLVIAGAQARIVPDYTVTEAQATGRPPATTGTGAGFASGGPAPLEAPVRAELPAALPPVAPAPAAPVPPPAPDEVPIAL